MVSKPMRSAAKAAEKAAVSDSSQAHAADDTSPAARSPQPAAPVAAGARGDSPRANDGFPLELIYSGESDGASDSGKTVRLPESLAAADYEPSSKKARSNSKTHGSYHSRFDSEDEEKPHLLLPRIRLCANTTMARAIVKAVIVVSFLLLVPHWLLAVEQCGVAQLIEKDTRTVSTS
ncbi:unnamed protein product [Peronospora destructor]|uniref:Transmembrane protein n=1 Tax=Peronospora destructor TaxID=86335 RepID=A0AAV0UDL1_9STRA|nr:unnamed protein product [Peronospora destructor]